MVLQGSLGFLWGWICLAHFGILRVTCVFLFYFIKGRPNMVTPTKGPAWGVGPRFDLGADLRGLVAWW